MTCRCGAVERFDSKGMDMVLTGGEQRHDVGEQDGMWINRKKGGERAGVNGIRQHKAPQNETRRFEMGRSRIEKSRKRREGGQNKMKQYGRNETRRDWMVRKKTDQDVTKRDVTRCDGMEARRRTEQK